MYLIESSRNLVMCNLNRLNINLVSVDITLKLTG